MTPITEDWLKSVGFKWHQLERQRDKQWLLWIVADGMSFEELGIEVTPVGLSTFDGQWHCWLRSDCSHRYSRFIHIRHLCWQEELIRMIEGLSGQPWNPELHVYGMLRTPEAVEHIRRTEQRADMRKMLTSTPYAKWREIEKDDTRGGALPEHMEEHRKAGLPGK